MKIQVLGCYGNILGGCLMNAFLIIGAVVRDGLCAKPYNPSSFKGIMYDLAFLALGGCGIYFDEILRSCSV
jgi:hypothetical protein